MRAVLYARVTTTDQREASLDDQIRECEDLCVREGFTIVGRVTDHGLSGESVERPGYQLILRAIERGDADVIVAHELSRLWRSPGEQALQMEQFEFLGRHVVTCNGVDTRREGFEFRVAVEGAQSKTELKRIASRVHRSHKGNALQGRSTGGRTYGYKSVPILDPVRKDAYGRSEIVGATRVIDPETADVVRRIFALYADGLSPRNIAARLNAEGIPSPGASWRRVTRRRDAKWMASTIYGDASKGSGILNNELYLGRVIWNRRQMKKRPRSAKRVALMRAESEHVVREDPALRIIDDTLWQRVRERRAKQAHELGARVIGGIRKRRPGGGRPPRYLLSGILRCGVCDAGFVMTNARSYQCASHAYGGEAACAVSISLPRERAERLILEAVRTELLNPARLAELEMRYRTFEAPPVDHSARLSALDREERNLTTAIKDGGELPALLGALKEIQLEREKLQALTVGSRPKTARRASMEPVERRAARLLKQIAQGGEMARSAMLALFPEGILLEPASSPHHLWACFADGVGMALFDQPDLTTEFPIVGNRLVAGAGFEPATFGL